MNDLIRTILGVLAVALIIFIIVANIWLLLIVAAVALAARYIYRRFFLKRPFLDSQIDITDFLGSLGSHGSRGSRGPLGSHGSRGSHGSSKPSGPPPGPNASDSDKNYDIVIDSQTNEEFRIPRRK
jgi:hypothetical protein